MAFGISGAAGFLCASQCEGSKLDRRISLDELREYDQGCWVSYKGGVYDVTEFLDAHPGGPHRIMMVSGQDLGPFWQVYDLHRQRPHILKLLEKYRVGSLSPDDADRSERESSFASAYTDDPARPRKSELHIPSEHPWNHEPPLSALVDSFYTPNDLFFVRNHNPVPDLDQGDWELEIVGDEKSGMQTCKFSLADLKSKFEKVEVVATLQCAGNRQQDFVHTGRPLFVAPHWNNSAIGCAKWGGVRVRDVLAACGLDVDGMALGKVSHSHVKMVNFIAEDTDETGVPYAGVLPVGKVIDPFGDAILAYEMNGETLPRDHGYPIRLLAPGHAGCRNVKWVRQIQLSAAASKLDSGSKLDRHFAPNVTFIDHLRHGDDHVRLDQGPVIQTFPVQSVLCQVKGLQTDGASREVRLTDSPFSFGQNGEVSANIVGEIDGAVDEVEIRGVAYSGGGRGICRVEVAIDGGQNFVAAELTSTPVLAAEDEKHGAPESGQGKHWAWVQYRQRVPLTDDMKNKLRHGEKVELEVVAKAVDGDMNTQPEKMEHAWNVLGICPNHWPRAKVVVLP